MIMKIKTRTERLCLPILRRSIFSELWPEFQVSIDLKRLDPALN